MNQSEVFITDREYGAIEWISIDEIHNRKTKEERIKIAKLIWV